MKSTDFINEGSLVGQHASLQRDGKQIAGIITKDLGEKVRFRPSDGSGAMMTVFKKNLKDATLQHNTIGEGDVIDFPLEKRGKRLDPITGTVVPDIDTNKHLRDSRKPGQLFIGDLVRDYGTLDDKTNKFKVGYIEEIKGSRCVLRYNQGDEWETGLVNCKLISEEKFFPFPNQTGR